MDKELRTATVVEASNNGIVLVRDDESNEIFGFTLESFRDYHGQPIKLLRLKTGKRVKFFKEDKRIKDVEVVE